MPVSDLDIVAELVDSFGQPATLDGGVEEIAVALDDQVEDDINRGIAVAITVLQFAKRSDVKHNSVWFLKKSGTTYRGYGAPECDSDGLMTQKVRKV